MNWVSDGHFISAKFERFEITVWPFGEIYQIVITIDDVRVGLEPARTLSDAKQKGLDWINQYKENGPKNPEEVIADLGKYDFSREKSLNQMFFTAGCGFSWLDGALIEFDQEPKPDILYRIENSVDRSIKMLEAICKAKGIDVPQENIEPEPKYHLQNNCNILKIPENIRSEWFAVTKEAAELLRDKGIDKLDQETGERILKQLENKT